MQGIAKQLAMSIRGIFVGNFMRRIRFVIGNFFADSYLSHDQKTLIYIITLLFLGNGFSGTFVNAFLFSNGGGLKSVLIYNMYNYGSVVVCSLGVALLARRISLKNSLILGMVFYITMYALILVLQKSIGAYAGVVGILTGLASSFFYIPHSCLIFQMTDNSGRDYYFSRQGIFTTIGSMIAPFTAGHLISIIGGINGYLSMFALSLLMYFVAGVLAFRLSRTNMINKRSYLLATIRLAMTRANFRNVLWASILRGLREGAMWVMVGTLLLKVTNKDTSMVGTYSLITSILLIASFQISQKVLRYENRSKYLFISVCALALPSLLFLIEVSVWTIFAYGIISTVFMAFFNTPVSSIYYNVLSTLTGSSKRSLEGMAIQESMLNVGRFLAVLILLFVVLEQEQVVFVLVGASVLQLLTWLFYHRAEKISETSRGRS